MLAEGGGVETGAFLLLLLLLALAAVVVVVVVVGGRTTTDGFGGRRPIVGMVERVRADGGRTRGRRHYIYTILSPVHLYTGRGRDTKEDTKEKGENNYISIIWTTPPVEWN